MIKLDEKPGHFGELIANESVHHHSIIIMEKHYGNTIEYIVRKHGFSLSDLARLLSISRRSLYNWFKKEEVRPDIISRIGAVIGYDFSKDFPELFTSDDFSSRNRVEQAQAEEPTIGDYIWKDKYIRLLEEYNRMFSHISDASVA